MAIKLASGPGGHPEIGDTVYKSDGTELGQIGFFYSHIREDVWGVKIGSDEEDHSIIVIKRVPAVDAEKKEIPGSYGLVRLNEAFIDNNNRNRPGRPAIAIQNNTGEAANLIIPVESEG